MGERGFRQVCGRNQKTGAYRRFSAAIRLQPALSGGLGQKNKPGKKGVPMPEFSDKETQRAASGHENSKKSSNRGPDAEIEKN